MRNSCRIECWLPESLATAIKEIADLEMLTESAVARRAIAFYLQQVGMLPRANGQRKPMQEEEQLTNG